MDERPLLSICIPTIERPEPLKNCLESIVRQPEFHTESVEVIISRNPSMYDKQEIGQAYAEKYENIHYFRNEEDISDMNFAVALNRAHGKLRKLISDSVVLMPGSIAYLCDMARKFEKEKPHLFFKNSGTEKNPDKKIKIVDFNHFMGKVGYHITWINSFAAWDTECQNIAEDSEGCKTKLWQVWKICRLFEEKNRGVVLYKKILEPQVLKEKIFNYDFDQIFYKNFFALLEPCVEKGLLSVSCREKTEAELLFLFFTNWMICWELQMPGYTYTKNENFKQKVLEIYKDKPYYKVFLQYYKLRMLITKSRLYLKAKRGGNKS